MDSFNITIIARKCCRIKNNCAIIACLALIFMACSCTPQSVRTSSKPFAKIRNKETVSNNEESKTVNISQKEENREPVPDLNNALDEGTTLQDSDQPEPVQQPVRKIPTLREQMKIYTSEQNQIKERINTIQDDLDDIKDALTGLKEVLTSNKINTKLAESGERYINEDNAGNLPNDEGLILSDEAEQDVVKPVAKKIVKNVQNTKSASERITAPKKSDNKVKNTKAAKNEVNREKSRKKEPVPVKINDQELRKGLDLIAKKDYRNAIIVLNDMILNNRGNGDCGNCYYWLGEAYFGLHQYDRSIDCFRMVLQSKNTDKKDDAQMMIAEAHARSGQVAEARKAYQSILEKYPQSEFIARARKMLQQM